MPIQQLILSQFSICHSIKECSQIATNPNHFLPQDTVISICLDARIVVVKMRNWLINNMAIKDGCVSSDLTLFSQLL